MNKHIKTTVLTGVGKREDVLIPRFTLIPTDVTLQFQRIQFDVQLKLAMFMNEAQCQSSPVEGLHATSPCFSCGQLYVAFSRVRSLKNLYVCAPNGSTKNIVHPKTLTE